MHSASVRVVGNVSEIPVSADLLRLFHLALYHLRRLSLHPRNERFPAHPHRAHEQSQRHTDTDLPETRAAIQMRVVVVAMSRIFAASQRQNASKRGCPTDDNACFLAVYLGEYVHPRSADCLCQCGR